MAVEEKPFPFDVPSTRDCREELVRRPILAFLVVVACFRDTFYLLCMKKKKVKVKTGAIPIR